MKLRALLAAFGIVLALGTAAIATVIGGTNTAIRGTSSANVSDTNSKLFNFITDVGAKCNGVADDGPALSKAGVMMRAAQATTPTIGVTLFVPPNVNCQWLSCPAASDGAFGPFAGLTNLTFIATGATIFGNGSSCVKYSSDIPTPAVQFKFTPNLVGDTCVTMVNSGDEANYPVGRWVLVAGQGMQTNSFPPNYAYWEYQQVASTPTGQVCFKGSMKNAYPDGTHVVELGNGSGLGVNANCSNVSCGGQGKLVLMNPTWGSTFHFIGGTWLFQTSLAWPEQTVILDNMTWTGGGQNCYLPSLTQTVIYNNNNAGTCTSEDDKEVDAIIVNGGTLNTNFQSQSINTITLNSNATVSSVGTPITVNCNNSTFNNGNLIRFASAFGSLQTFFNGNNCKFPDFSVQGSVVNTVQVLPSTGMNGQFTYDGAGHWVSTNNDIYQGNPNYPTWISRGGSMRFTCCGNAANDYDNKVTIGDSQYAPLGSISGTLTVTISPSPGATNPAPNTGTLGYSANAYPIVTCVGCVGLTNFNSTGQMAVDLNNAAAQTALAFTYSKRVYTCINNIPNVAGSYDINTTQNLTIAGFLTTLKFNVTTADTNVSDTTATIASVPIRHFNTSTGVETVHPTTYATVDLLHTGLRTVTLTASLGAVGGDALNPPGANTFLAAGNLNVTNFSLTGVTNGTAAQCPVVSIEWITSN